jgi:putative ATPase
MSRKRGPAEAGPSLFTTSRRSQPLAARMRPRTLDEVVGQEDILAPDKPLRAAIERGEPGSLIFWGPPGAGKTTLAHVIAESTRRHFVPFSAVTEGVPRIREIAGEAQNRLAAGGAQTILFVDEIHRLNKAQQDSLLPHVEEGTFTLIGATTETPSFAINAALLSRCRVVVLKPLAPDQIAIILRRSLEDDEHGLGPLGVRADTAVLAAIAESAGGDARRALTILEAAAAHVGAGGTIDLEVAQEAVQHRFARYDRAGEEHYNMLSAYHKSLRGSDPDGALYWMARMIEGGEDPLTLFRRAIAMAAEDIGLADPNALQLAVAARDAYQMLGPPEGYLPLAEMTIYLATSPKSNAAYSALQAALRAARATPYASVPLNIRNAPTELHRELGHHEGYRYAHDSANAYLPQQYLPEELGGARFYEPGRFGFEREIAKRLEWWKRLREEGEPEGGDGG